MDSQKIQTLALIGCGQVGTSILLAMAKQGKTLPTAVFDTNPETAPLIHQKFEAEGLDPSFITFEPSIEKAVQDSDLIILATPMSKFEQAAEVIAIHAKAGTILTDTGSAKKVAIENITEGIKGSSLKYVAAHPGNGSQGAGPLTASAGNILGKNSTMFLISEEGSEFIPEKGSPEETVQNFWKNMGVITAFITTEKHDQFFGQCSHFQHALVFALMNTAIEKPETLHNFRNAGTALRNLSRVAISAIKEGEPSALAQMWEPIFEQNREPIQDAYARFHKHLFSFTHAIESHDFAHLKENLERAKKFRDSFDDPERREIVTGEFDDLEKIPLFEANRKGALTAVFERKSLSPLSTNLLLPYAIAYAQLMSAYDIDPHFVAAKANPSFRDGTHPTTYSVDHMIGLLQTHQQHFVAAAHDFTDKLTQLMDAIGNQDNDYIHDTILAAQSIRNTMPAPRKGDAVRSEYERKSEPV